jgi:hypothetical protein
MAEAQFSYTGDTYLFADGIREELSNLITDISPEETPFVSNIGRGSVSNTHYEWLTDALGAASTTNAVIEGADLDGGAAERVYTDATARVRLGNYTQISRKTVSISGSQRAVNNAGVSDELAYQVAKMGKELKRDMESILTSEQPASAGGAPATARKTAGFEAFIYTNVNMSATGSSDPTLSGTTNGYPNAGPVNGTQRSFTDVILKDVIQQIWTSGGTPKIVLLGPVNKARASGFTGIADIRKDAPGAKPATVIGAVDVYVSDFGNVTFVPSRFSRERSALFVDPEYASVEYLRPFQLEDMAKTGDAEKRMLVVEYGLKLSTEKAHGIARDLTTT